MKFKPILFAFTVIFLSGCSNNDNSSSGSLNDTISDEKPTLLPYDIDKTGSINRFYANDENSENIVIPSTYSIDSDGRIITGRGMGAAIPFGLKIQELLLGRGSAEEMAERIVFKGAF